MEHRFVFLLPAAVAIALTVMPAFASCITPDSEAPSDRDWNQLREEIAGFAPLEEPGLRVGAQRVFRLRPEGDASTRDALLARLSDMAPRIEELQRSMVIEPRRAVVLVESHTDGFDESMAFTYCAENGESHWLEENIDGLDALPAGTCLIVMFPDRIGGSRLYDFDLAHEWMHTMQRDAFGEAYGDEAWWREGSADWFAHKVVPAATERDHVIERFFTQQQSCELPDHSYDAQVFFFWGEPLFGLPWVFELGFASGDYLRQAEQAAELLPPGRWLDWAVAQAEEAITMPDGRPLPEQVHKPAIDLGRECRATITGPALSVQVREVSLPPEMGGTLQIEAGEAQVALRGVDGDWSRATGSTGIAPPPSPFTLAAISPSGADLSVDLSAGTATPSGCKCFVGRWIERPTAGPEDQLDGAREALDMLGGMGIGEEQTRDAADFLAGAVLRDSFRFRNEFAELAAEVRYDQSGPVLTIGPDGSFQIDDPHIISREDVRIDYRVYRHSGAWHDENGRLELDIATFTFDGIVEGPNSDGPQPITDEVTSASASAFTGGGGNWRAACHGNRLTLMPWEPPGHTPAGTAVELVKH
ncbi:hypothetical protein [Maritimibacter sp. 55A14]|uniref:hypothetical protein n=1 Tax=Maritimibacter sp. 55A14 TaxID=2174844 RepID=UPI0011B1F101|nr:hypothetical protein [Maritimibacter sp. 55A14]